MDMPIRDKSLQHTRDGNLSPASWASPTNLKLGPDRTLILLDRKNRAKSGLARLARWA